LENIIKDILEKYSFWNGVAVIKPF
jgi:hypothetical protein